MRELKWTVHPTGWVESFEVLEDEEESEFEDEALKALQGIEKRDVFAQCMFYIGDILRFRQSFSPETGKPEPFCYVYFEGLMTHHIAIPYKELSKIVLEYHAAKK